MATTKDDRIYIRVQSEIKDDFERIAQHRGLSTSAMLHSMIVQKIHDERERKPQIFGDGTTIALNGKVQKEESPPSPKEKTSVNARSRYKLNQTLPTRSDGDLPLVDEASSAVIEEEDGEDE